MIVHAEPAQDLHIDGFPNQSSRARVLLWRVCGICSPLKGPQVQMDENAPVLLAAGLCTAVGLWKAPGSGCLPAGRALLSASGFLGAATGLDRTGFLLGCAFGWGLRLLGFAAVGFRAVALA